MLSRTRKLLPGVVSALKKKQVRVPALGPAPGPGPGPALGSAGRGRRRGCGSAALRCAGLGWGMARCEAKDSPLLCLVLATHTVANNGPHRLLSLPHLACARLNVNTHCAWHAQVNSLVSVSSAQLQPFLRSKEAKDLLAYLELVGARGDSADEALRRVLNVPKVRMHARTHTHPRARARTQPRLPASLRGFSIFSDLRPFLDTSRAAARLPPSCSVSLCMRSAGWAPLCCSSWRARRRRSAPR